MWSRISRGSSSKLMLMTGKWFSGSSGRDGKEQHKLVDLLDLLDRHCACAEVFHNLRACRATLPETTCILCLSFLLLAIYETVLSTRWYGWISEHRFPFHSSDCCAVMIQSLRFYHISFEPLTLLAWCIAARPSVLHTDSIIDI